MKYYKARKDFALKQITDQNILIPTGEQVFRNNSIIVMNETAILLWQSLGEYKNIFQITKILCDEFDVKANAVLDDIDLFLSSLLNVDALEVKDVEVDENSAFAAVS